MGAHMSVAGGVDRAIDRARQVGCTALQIFLKNNNQWKGPPLKDEAIARFREEMARGDIAPPVAHASYLLNFAGENKAQLAKSRENLLDDLRRAETLGVVGIVLHPGAHLGRGETVGVAQIAREIDRLLERTDGSRVAIYLETTAGQGTTIGHRFEHLRDIIASVERRDRVAVCLDTCHVFAAGYDLRTPSALKVTLDEFDRVIGLGKLAFLHLNDSKKEFDSRRDRHEHIGKGFIGESGFRALMKEKRLAKIPRVLETPKPAR
jgi:deoxyribonuclease-4